MNKIEIGNNIGSVLEKKGISKKKIAIDLGKDYSTMHRLITKDSLANTTLKTIVEIADYLGVDIKELY